MLVYVETVLFLFSFWLLNMKVFLVIKYKLLVEVIMFNFYDIYNFGFWTHNTQSVLVTRKIVGKEENAVS